ncbi:MAG: thiol reductant ABC exporter subunit CydC [Actinomycetes bacterium]
MAKQSGRDLFREIGGTRRWVALSSALGIITIGSGIGLLAMATYLLTRSAILGAAASLSLTILGVRFFAITRVVGRYCERYLGHLGTFRVLTRLRVSLFNALLLNDAVVLADQRRGDVVTGLVDDVETMQDRILRVSSPPIIAIGTLTIGITALVAIAFETAIILTLCFLTAALLLPSLLKSRTKVQAAELVSLRADRLSEATEYLEGLETLSIWGREDLFIQSLDQFDQHETAVTRQLTITRAVLDAAVILITGACAIAIVFALHSTDSTTGEIWWIAATPLIALASFEALGPLLAAPEYRAQTNEAASRIMTLTEPSRSNTPALNSSPPTDSGYPENPAIEINGLSFAYEVDSPIFTDVSLVIPFGSTVAIVAPSGTGKSTLLQLLLGFLPCRSDMISIGGIAPMNLGSLERPIVTAVMQFDHVFDTTIRDNLLVGDGDATDERLYEVCAIAGLVPFLEARPEGLDAPIGSNGELLSGGERQRLMIARALLADSPVLLLDEATEHLEPEMRASVIDAILTARRGRTTVILAHDIDAISRADVVYEISSESFITRGN